MVLLGTDATKNPLDYPHITLMERPLATADWELLDFLKSHVKGTGRWVKSPDMPKKAFYTLYSFLVRLTGLTLWWWQCTS